MRPAYQLPQGAMHAMPAMPVAGAHGHVSSPHVVMRAPLPGYGSPTAQMHQAAGMESFMRILLVDCLNIWSNLCYYYVIIIYCLLLSIIMYFSYYYAIIIDYCILFFILHWHMLCNVMSWNLIWWDAMRCMHAWTYCIFYDLAQATKICVCLRKTTRHNKKKCFGWHSCVYISFIQEGWKHHLEL